MYRKKLLLPQLKRLNGASLPSKMDLLQSLQTLEDWRKKFNDTNYGLGYDQYCTDEKMNYPEAYALWGDGYLKLFKFTKNEIFLISALNCVEWLYNNSNEKYEHLSWGLPWEWKGISKDYSYITTSVFAGDLFIDLYKNTNDEKYLKYALSVGDWIIDECGFEEKDNEVWFNYSDHQSLKKPIFNAISMASGFFSNLNTLIKNIKYDNLSRKSTTYVINNQNPDGSWYYEEEKKHIDNVHIGYTIEGLCAVYDSAPQLKEKIRTALAKSHDFYWNKLYTPEGIGKAILLLKFTSKIKYSILRRNQEARLWGYASAIRSFSNMSRILGVPNKGLIIARYIVQNLQNKEGEFKFKTNVDKYFIRHEAHVFDALATLLLTFD